MNTEHTLEAEVAARTAAGNPPTTIKHITAQLAALGYRLDRTTDCRSVSRWMSGPRAGSTYPVITTDVIEIDTRLSFANIYARRDANFKALQELRDTLHAVTQNAILEI